MSGSNPFARQSGTTFVVMLAGAFAACAPQEITLADVPVQRDETPVVTGGPCVDDDDCAAAFFCGKTRCGDVTGRCQIRPVVCDDRLAPHCGCDGVTYWNDCLRQRAGVNLVTEGECTGNAAPCDPPSRPCAGAGASCARLRPSRARCAEREERGPGVCWELPDTCPPASGAVFLPCDPGAATCVDACTAIRSERPHQLSPAASCAKLPGKKTRQKPRKNQA